MFYEDIVREILTYFGEAFHDLFSYDEVIIAPAYPLMNFPYHLIMDNGKTLIEVTKVKYVPHASVARILKERSSKRENCKGIYRALIIYSPDTYEADIEALEIENILPNSEVIDASKLSKDDLLKKIGEDAEILHFACHAIAMPKAQYSYLSVGEPIIKNGRIIGRKEKYRIYLYDLLNIKPLDLVCLSACESGRYDESIDVLGLPLAFFAKGAKKVVATQWIVYGESTRVFFGEFYRLRARGYSDYDAYRQSLLNLKKKYNKTYYWGPFYSLSVRIRF